MKARDLGYDKDEIESLVGPDRDRAQNLADSIHHVQRAVKIGKSLSRLFALNSKNAADASAVATMNTAQSSLQVEQDILAELQKKRINEETLEIKEEEARKIAIAKGQEEILKNGSKILTSGVVTFPPLTDVFLVSAIDISKTVSKILLGLLTAVFLLRVSISGLRLNSMDAYGKLLEDSFLCAIMLLSYSRYHHLLLGEGFCHFLR